MKYVYGLLLKKKLSFCARRKVSFKIIPCHKISEKTRLLRKIIFVIEETRVFYLFYGGSVFEGCFLRVLNFTFLYILVTTCIFWFSSNIYTTQIVRVDSISTSFVCFPNSRKKQDDKTIRKRKKFLKIMVAFLILKATIFFCYSIFWRTENLL